MVVSLGSLSIPLNRKYTKLPPRIPQPSHRHAAPSGPWPWMDLDSDVDPDQLDATHTSNDVVANCTHEDCNGCWKGYPQSLFPNWTPDQVKRSGIANAVKNYPRDKPCVIYYVDVDNEGQFTDYAHNSVADERVDKFWEEIKGKRHRDGIRVRALFLENLSGPVLQILGTKYNVEPFFFSSSLNWIPARWQEGVRPKEGDHITITLTFLRSMQNSMTVPSSPTSSFYAATMLSDGEPLQREQVIDTQSPLLIRSDSYDRILLLDLLAIHLVRDKTSSTIISFHPSSQWRTTSAKRLHSRVRFAGQSVYWQNIFKKSNDPTFVLLAIIWHALYAWDEALEILYAHICSLETRVINTSDMDMTKELHIIRAHLLHYASLLQDFEKTVKFVQDTPNPAMDSWDKAERENSKGLLQKECHNLLSEIYRLQGSRHMQDMRLKNVMNLVFSSVNILDSRHMQRLTEAAVRDSEAMKQVSYLSMVFLPASFVAGIFGMNIKEINPGTSGSLFHYVVAAIPLTIVTIWVVMAVQSKYMFDHNGEHTPWLSRFLWPLTMLRRLKDRKLAQRNGSGLDHRA